MSNFESDCRVLNNTRNIENKFPVYFIGTNKYMEKYYNSTLKYFNNIKYELIETKHLEILKHKKNILNSIKIILES